MKSKNECCDVVGACVSVCVTLMGWLATVLVTGGVVMICDVAVSLMLVSFDCFGCFFVDFLAILTCPYIPCPKFLCPLS